MFQIIESKQHNALVEVEFLTGKNSFFDEASDLVARDAEEIGCALQGDFTRRDLRLFSWFIP